MATGGASDIDRGTDETFENLCSVCSRRNKNTEAQKFCTDCQEYFCSDCVNFHYDFPTLRDHQILDKAKFQSGSSVQFPMVPTERCKVHGHKPVDMYCRQHDAVGCSICMVMQHSTCKDKEYVPDYIKRVKVESSSAVVEQLGTIASSLSKLQETFLKEKTNLQSRKDETMQEIRKFRQEINKQLDELEKNIVKDLDRVFQYLNDKIDATLRELQATITEVQTAQDNLKSAGSNAAKMFVSNKMANNIAANAKEKVTTTQHQVYSTDISFVSNQKLRALLNKAEALGSISMPEGLQSQLRGSNPLPSVATTQTNTTSHGSQSSIPLLQVNNSKKSVREKSDREGIGCFIRSVCELEDGTIILSDHSQNKLKRLNSFYMVRDSCIVPLYPCQVCTISSQEVAVCCGSSCLIQFVSIGHTMQKTKQIKTGFECSGLAYNDEKLFISDGFPSVYVYTLTGERLQQFNKPGIFSRMFGDNYETGIAVSSDGSTIYITHSEKGLIILNKDGQLVEKCTDYKLKEEVSNNTVDERNVRLEVFSNEQCAGENDYSRSRPACGVCLYKNNSVLVCGKNYRNVLQFTPDGKLIGQVLQSDKCYAVCYCKKTSKLIVSLGNEIDIYDINK